MVPPNSALKKENVNLIWDDVQHQQRLGFFRKFPEDELPDGEMPAYRPILKFMFDINCECWRMIVERGQLQLTQDRSKKTLLAVQRQRSRKPNQRRHCFQPLPNQDPRQIKKGNHYQIKTQDKSRKALPANLNKDYQTPPFGELQEHSESCLKDEIQLWKNGAFIICTAR